MYYSFDRGIEVLTFALQIHIKNGKGEDPR